MLDTKTTDLIKKSLKRMGFVDSFLEGVEKMQPIPKIRDFNSECDYYVGRAKEGIIIAKISHNEKNDDKCYVEVKPI